MTIKEAVELYNKKTGQIEDIKKMTNDITERNISFLKDPMGYWQISEREMMKIGDYLGLLIDILEAQLNRSFDMSAEDAAI